MATKKTDQRFYTGWVLVERDEDAEEMAWVAHCLDFDLVASGRTAREAIESVRECVAIAVCDDLNADLDPHGRNQAPAEEWERLWHAVNNGKPVRFSDVEADARLMLVSQIVVGVMLVNDSLVEDTMAPADPDRFNSYQAAA